MYRLQGTIRNKNNESHLSYFPYNRTTTSSMHHGTSLEDRFLIATAEQTVENVTAAWCTRISIQTSEFSPHLEVVYPADIVILVVGRLEEQHCLQPFELNQHLVPLIHEQTARRVELKQPTSHRLPGEWS